MADPSAKSFLKLLRRSEIVAERKLDAALSELSRRFNGEVVTTDDLSAHLIATGLITDWHREKLCAGKYKGFFLGKYKLLGHLGTGGMSSVFLAEHKISGQKRAIKVLPRKKVPDKTYLDRFYREGRAAASLNHPNIVRIYDICNDADTHYMVMEWVDGRDLYEIVKADGAMGFEESARAIADACKGLVHAHERNLVHRDIKPANLLRTRSGDIKILDLGLALLRADDEESLTILHNEKVMGTADYLAPEQAVNSHEVDLRADIYSLGCTLYYLLTGHPPFPNGTLAQRIAMHQTKEPEGILSSRGDCPEALVSICDLMMRKAPDERPQTCDEISGMLMEYINTGEVTFDQPFAIDVSGASKRNSTGIVSSSTDSSGAREAVVITPPQDQMPDAPLAIPASPFEIDVASGADSGKSGRKSNAGKRNGASENAKSPSTKKQNQGMAPTVADIPPPDLGALGSSSSGRRKKKKALIPVWALILMILVLFGMLIAILAIISSVMGTGASPVESTSIFNVTRDGVASTVF
ncbi:MAG: serine/threonine-protein kinase [Planctomycetota bacterium]